MKTFYGLWLSIRNSRNPAFRRLYRAMRSALYFHISYGKTIGLALFNLRVFLIYAWNEYGEGGIVAPTRGDGFMKLETIRAVFATD